VTLLIGCILGYSFAVFMTPKRTFPDFELSGEFRVASVPIALPEPWGYSKQGALDNGLATPVYVLGILDDIGQRARVTQVATAQKLGQYYAPGNLILNLDSLEDTVYSALLLSGDGLQFSFENEPKNLLRVYYVILDDGPRIVRELVVELTTP
jgi:hypothetical protein